MPIPFEALPPRGHVVSRQRRASQSSACPETSAGLGRRSVRAVDCQVPSRSFCSLPGNCKATRKEDFLLVRRTRTKI